MCALVSASAASSLSEDSAASPALGRPFPYVIYLPDGYERGDLRYPVIYLLHGAGGNQTSWSIDGTIKATADRMIASGSIPPAIIVMPGCRGCWWVDGAADRAETAFWTDLVPAIAHKYRTVETRRGMALGGLSAGGYGAVRYALRYPDRVAAVAALSPAVYADLPPANSAARSQPPFRTRDGAFDAAAWKAKNYPSLIDDYFKQKDRVAFYLLSGDNDNYGIAFETMTLFRRLYDRQPDLAELRIVDGDHTWSIWAKTIENAMRYMFAHLDKPVVMPALVVAQQPTGAPAKAPVAAAAMQSATVSPANAQQASPLMRSSGQVSHIP